MFSDQFLTFVKSLHEAVAKMRLLKVMRASIFSQRVVFQHMQFLYLIFQLDNFCLTTKECRDDE